VLASCKRESRPVYIELPRDMVTVPCGEVPPLASEPDDLPALSACVDETLERLAAASSPVLLVGVEVRRFGLEKEVGELALKLGLPVVTTLMGRGLMFDTATPPTVRSRWATTPEPECGCAPMSRHCSPGSLIVPLSSRWPDLNQWCSGVGW